MHCSWRINVTILFYKKYVASNKYCCMYTVHFMEYNYNTMLLSVDRRQTAATEVP